MILLGFWQLNRLSERRHMNALINEKISLKPINLAETDTHANTNRANTDTDTDTDTELMQYSQVKAEGVYRVEYEVMIANQSYQGQPGVWLATPLELEDNQFVVVVRGWVPRRNVLGFDVRPVSPPEGNVQVAGLAFKSQKGGKVGVTASGEKSELSQVDLELFEQLSGLEVMDFWVRLSTQTPPQSDLPVLIPVPVLDDGPHLSYAMQWFFFTSGTVIVYAIILRRVVIQDRVDIRRVDKGAGQ